MVNMHVMKSGVFGVVNNVLFGSIILQSVPHGGCLPMVWHRSMMSVVMGYWGSELIFNLTTQW